MNLENLTKEIKEKVKPGTKPSDLKKAPAEKSRPEPVVRKNSTAGAVAVVDFRMEKIEEELSDLNKELTVLTGNTEKRLEKLSQLPSWETTWRVVLLAINFFLLCLTIFQIYQKNK